MEKVKKFISALKAEVVRIVWPTKKVLAANTGTSLAVIFIVAAIMFGFDSGASALVQFVLRFF